MSEQPAALLSRSTYLPIPGKSEGFISRDVPDQEVIEEDPSVVIKPGIFRPCRHCMATKAIQISSMLDEMETVLQRLTLDKRDKMRSALFRGYLRYHRL
jgi:hypothetical protein